jgi:hypothetical protein
MENDPMITGHINSFDRFIRKGGSGAMSMICVSCARTVPARDKVLSFRGQFKKLCRACHFSADEATNRTKAEPDNFIESFIRFTCDYGYLIGLLVCVWVIQASLHRHPASFAKIEQLQKTLVVKTSQLIPLLGP